MGMFKELAQTLGADAGLSSAEELGEKVLHLLLAAVLAAVVAYRPWRRLMRHPLRTNYEIADTQVMLAVAGAVIVTIVGDSVARAFGLVGLGSVMRFRSVIDDTREAALMFLMIGIGMSCGLGLMGLAAVVAVFTMVGLILLDRLSQANYTRVSVRVDQPRAALAGIQTAFPTARILEAPNTKTVAQGAGTIVVEMNGETTGADAAAILKLLGDRGVPGVKSVALRDR
jgi:uncharacterized membrane protein YhiD involved in acid resistance